MDLTIGCGALAALVVACALFARCVCTWWDGLGKDREARQRETEERLRAIDRERQQQDERHRLVQAEQEKKRAELAALEAARPPSERAAIALQVLSVPGASRAEVCRARELLAPIQQKDLAGADVRQAMALMRAKEAELLQAERAELESSRSVVCSDGSISPTCLCKGPRRGCCSHHGGVAGCEALPTSISCP